MGEHLWTLLHEGQCEERTRRPKPRPCFTALPGPCPMKGLTAPWGPNRPPLAQRVCWLLLCLCRALGPVLGSSVPQWGQQQARHFHKWLRAQFCSLLMKGSSQLASSPNPKGESSLGSFQPRPASRHGLICSMASSEDALDTLSREDPGSKFSPLWPSHFCYGAEPAPGG